MFARAAFCDVTPRDRPIELAGFVERRISSTVLDPIEISALLLESDSSRCLILSFDLMFVGSELESMLLPRLTSLGFAPSDVMLLASHTHNAPATDRACKPLGTTDSKFVSDAADAVEGLVRRIEDEPPAKLSLDIFRGRLNHSLNRRRRWPFPTLNRTHGLKWRSVAFSPNPSGPKDEEATVIVLRNLDDGKALALFWHYACHPTAAGGIDGLSADYPGAVRSLLRERFGETPCLFAQGFCGDVTANLPPSRQKFTLRNEFKRIRRMVAAGYLFRDVTPADRLAWIQSLAAAVDNIVKGNPATTHVPERLSAGSASIALDHFFTGQAPYKRLTARVARIDQLLEIVALSAEPTIEWIGIFDRVAPRVSQQIRLYTGYLGTVFGYLPTAKQVAEGGYEVEGFQSLFGLSGHFESGQIEPVVTACFKCAYEDMERKASRRGSLATASP